ncbi:hypothetical protein AURDEDRAFT_124554 [Auricularia subglabra TFB-10046 SS5]|nr:hypothetical protein AURDEDRAFT_124554 [Auricularia subglabra TFB-10046 SS5]
MVLMDAQWQKDESGFQRPSILTSSGSNTPAQSKDVVPQQAAAWGMHAAASTNSNRTSRGYAVTDPSGVVKTAGRWKSDAFLRYWRSVDSIVSAHLDLCDVLWTGSADNRKAPMF